VLMIGCFSHSWFVCMLYGDLESLYLYTFPEHKIDRGLLLFIDVDGLFD
jgi:hypothetical protein